MLLSFKKVGCLISYDLSLQIKKIIAYGEDVKQVSDVFNHHKNSVRSFFSSNRFQMFVISKKRLSASDFLLAVNS